MPTAPYVPPELKTEPAKPHDMTPDFNALCEWRLDAKDQIYAATKSNPLMLEEMEKAKLDEFRKLLVGKHVMWLINVEKIEPPQTVFLHSKYANPPPGSTEYGRPAVSVRFDRHADVNRVERVPPDLMRRLKQGEPCQVTGKVTDVTSGYTIWVEGAKIDLPSK